MTHSILFVGAIDARPELDFVAYLRWQQCTAYITSYGDAPSSLSELAEQTVDGAKILVRGSVDATKLLGTFPEQRFDAVVWIGPTNDDKLEDTPSLVEAFVTSAGQVLAPNGAAFVVQDLKTPNFRGILSLAGAKYCCELQLEGRLQTQHSTTKKALKSRADHLIAFMFDAGTVRRLNDVNNKKFVDGVTCIMSADRTNFAPPVLGENAIARNKADPTWALARRLGKKDIAGMIFDYAEEMQLKKRGQIA